ncbi:hypothetical protein A1E_01180 [Rickettsia canadensis str. McKiel]|uniref:Uncharacterized protein n=1 Tax=Rickettsia canadensis (strain McKiel) TaxID=293613 RepID=A8EXU8_RICCK|nr:hypothetical protein A1E_01180 [Rickettsia canadensis str. McKiel]
MKLGDYCTELEDIACGPYLTAFKKLFSKLLYSGRNKEKEIYLDIYKEVIDQIQASIKIIELNKLHSKS